MNYAKNKGNRGQEDYHMVTQRHIHLILNILHLGTLKAINRYVALICQCMAIVLPEYRVIVSRGTGHHSQVFLLNT